MENSNRPPKSIANVTIAGRIGKLPQRHTFSSGSSVLQFSVAVTRGIKNKVTNVWDNKTSWFECKAWKDVADQIEVAAKPGTWIELEGSLEMIKFTDRAGNEREKLEVTVWQINKLVDLPKYVKPANDIYETTYKANNPEEDEDTIF